MSWNSKTQNPKPITPKVPDLSAIASRRGVVLDRIARAAERVGRDPASVSLLAVSKTHPAETVRAAARAGQTLFGENRVAEGIAKIEALAGDNH